MEKAERILKNVDVSFISLVDRGANKKQFIYKSEHSETPNLEKEITIAKTDNDQRLVYGIVYSPDEVDSQGDMATSEVIKAMAYNFMKSNKNNNVDKQHTNVAGDGFVCESWLVKSSDSVFPLEKEGSWAVGIKVENEDTWQSIKKGEITGLSMAGLASVEEAKKDEEAVGIIAKALDFLGIKKDFNAELGRRKFNDFIYSLTGSLDKILWDEKKTDEQKKADILASVEQFKDAFTQVEFSKAGRSISASNMNKLKQIQTLIDELVGSVKEEESQEDETINKQEDTMTQEQVAEVVKSAIAEAVKPLNDKIAELEKSANDKNDVIAKQAERLEVLEKSAPNSQQQTDVNKSDNKISIAKSIFGI